MNEELVIHKRFSQVCSHFSDKVGLQIKTGSDWDQWTYGKIEAVSLRIAAFLIQQGFKKGDFAALCTENRPEWGTIYLGIMAAGLTCVPLDPQLTQKELENLINDCAANCLFVSHAVFQAKNIGKIKTGLKKIIVLDLDIEKENLIGFSRIKPILIKKDGWPEVSAEDVASLIYTSGTTGKPKGVMLTHKNICSNFQSIEKMRLFSEKDVFLSILPLHHIFAFTVTLITPLFSGARVTYTSTLRSDELLERMRETGVTVFAGVPQIFSLFYKNISEKINQVPFFLRIILTGMTEVFWQIRRHSGMNLSKLFLSKVHAPFGRCLRFFLSGGAKLSEEAAGFLMKTGFTILEGYGLTETSPGVSFNPLARQKIGSAGTAIPDVELKIDNPDASGTGEILIKGPNVMKGYYKRPDETSSIIKDGWFYSGDLGRIDKDGYLYITGRKKEIIVLSSGKNIYPEEIEAHYAGSPYIKEICVLGFNVDREERLAAVVVPDAAYCRKAGEVSIGSKVKLELEVLSEGLAAYKRVKGYLIVKEDIPRTRLGKIKRHEVERKYLDELKGLKPKTVTGEIFATDEDLPLISSDTGAKIMAVLMSQTKSQRQISSADHLELDLGIDSLGRVELTVALEHALHTRIPDRLMANVSTVKELIAEIEKLAPGEDVQRGPVTGSKNPVLWNEILNGDPTEDIIKKVDLSPGRFAIISMSLFSGILRLVFRTIWRLKVLGAQNIPEDGKCILCVNHGSYLDGFIVAASVPASLRKSLYVVGFRAYFEIPLIKNTIKIIRVIPIDPGTRLMETMQACAYVLKNGKIVCIFPEGERTIDGEVKEFKKGAGILAKELNVPLVPVYITGSYESWPRTKRFPRPHPVTITFGRPLYFEALKKEGLKSGAKDHYEAAVLSMRQEVVKLKGLSL